MCVVEPRRVARKRSRKPVLGKPLDELRRALGLGGRHRLDDPAGGVGGLGPRSSSAERVGQQRPARRRRRVGEDLAVAVADPHRLALDRAVAGEVGAR